MALTQRAAAKIRTWIEERTARGIHCDYIFCTIRQGEATGPFVDDAQKLTPGRPVQPATFGDW